LLSILLLRFQSSLFISATGFSK